MSTFPGVRRRSAHANGAKRTSTFKWALGEKGASFLAGCGPCLSNTML